MASITPLAQLPRIPTATPQPGRIGGGGTVGALERAYGASPANRPPETPPRRSRSPRRSRRSPRNQQRGGGLRRGAPSTTSPLRRPAPRSPSARTAPTLRQPASYKPPPVTQHTPAVSGGGARAVPKNTVRPLPKPRGGGSVSGGALGPAVSGVAAGAITALNGGTLGQSVGAGIGAGIGSAAGTVAGAAAGSIFGPVGTAVGGYLGGAAGGAAGAALGGYLGGLIDPPADIPGEQITGPDGGTVPIDFAKGFDATGIGGVSIVFERPWDGSISGFSVQSIEDDGTTGRQNWKALRLTNCTGVVFPKEAYVPGSITAISSGVCGAVEGPPPTGPAAHPARLLSNPVNLADSIPPPAPAAVPGSAAAPSAPTTPQPNKLPPPALRPPPENGAKPLAPPNDRPTSAPSESPNTVPGLRPQTRGFNGGQTVPRINPDTGEEELAQLSPQRQAELDPLKNGQLQSFEDRYVPFEDRYVPFSEKIAEHDELMPDFFPIPLGMPAGAPRAGDVAKPQAAPATATKQRPDGATTTKVQNPPTRRPTPPPPKTGSPCGCNGPVLKKLDQMSGTGAVAGQGANLAAQGASLAKILEKLNTMQQFAEKAWRATRIQKVLNVLTFVGVMHNVALLSRDVGETFGWVAGQALNVVGIEDEEGNTIDVYGWFTGSIETLLRGMLGDELYEDGRETWLKASAIVRSASMIIWTMRGIMDATQDLMEWVAENTGKIGNALKAFGVVGERAYPWMSERAQARNRIRARMSKVTGTLESTEDIASSFAMATGNVLEIQQEIGELEGQFSDFKGTVIEAIPDPWEDNSPVQEAFEQSKANSQSPDIASSDTSRG